MTLDGWVAPATFGGMWTRVGRNGIYEFSRTDPRQPHLGSCTCGQAWNSILPPAPCPSHGAFASFSTWC